MPKPRLAALCVFLAMALWSCAPWRSFPPPMPSPVRIWTVVLAQSGGFAGVNLAVRVKSDGTVRAQDVRTGREVTKQLPDADLREIERLLATIDRSVPGARPSICADCFLYDLEITGLGETTRWRGDDTALDGSGVSELIWFLGKLRDKALAGAI